MIITGILKDILSGLSKLTYNYLSNTNAEISADISSISNKIFSIQHPVAASSFNEEVTSLLREFQEIPEEKALSTFIDLLREGNLTISNRQFQYEIASSAISKELLLTNYRDSLKKAYIDFNGKVLSRDAATAQKVAVTFLNRAEIPEPPENDLAFCVTDMNSSEPWDTEVRIFETYNQQFKISRSEPHRR